MYGEPFDVPQPEELVFVSHFGGGEVFRSGLCYRRGRGRIGAPAGGRDRRSQGTTPALAAKRRPRRFLSSSASARPRRARPCRNLARPGGNATGINFSVTSWQQSGWNSCVSWCPERLVWVLVNPANAECRNDVARRRRLLAPSGCKSGYSTPAPAARSMRLSQLLRASVPTPSSSAPTPFSPAGASNWSIWRRATRSPRIFIARKFRGRRADELRNQHCGCLAPDRRLCRSHPQGRKAGGLAGRAGDASSSWSSTRDRQSARPRSAARCSPAPTR